MRTIEVDDDVFTSLEMASKLTKMAHSQIVRRLIMPPDSVTSANDKKPTPTKQEAPVNPRDRDLRDYVHSPRFLANRSIVDQFLGVLSFLQKQNPDKFATLQSMEGRKRKYIASTEGELENSGTSVNPKRIPNTSFWVVTNNDTNNKKMLLRQALTLLDYNSETIRLVPESLR
jgi:negative modulator of initiation of replication